MAKFNDSDGATITLFGLTPTELGALIGAVTGPLGLAFAAFNYLRDRAIVAIRVNYDLMKLEGSKEKRWTFVEIRNVGRRPVHISKVRLTCPGKTTHLLVQGLEGRTLEEGSAPLKCEAHQEDMETFVPIWWRLRIAVDDTARNEHYSDWLVERPRWAQDEPARFGAIAWNRLKNFGRQRVF